MNQLMRISEYQNGFTPASRPDRRTVIRRIQRGELPGRRIGGTWYVDPNAPLPAPPSLQDRAAAIYGRLIARRDNNG